MPRRGCRVFLWAMSLPFLTVACRAARASESPQPVGARQCPVSVDEGRSRVQPTALDSSLTQARVRWAVADLLSALNSREVADLSVRYDWTGNVKERDDFLAHARGPVASTRLSRESGETWWSDAPGRKQQAICLTLDIRWNNGGGVAWTQKAALRATVTDDGRAAWLSRLQVADLSQ